MNASRWTTTLLVAAVLCSRGSAQEATRTSRQGDALRRWIAAERRIDQPAIAPLVTLPSGPPTRSFQRGLAPRPVQVNVDALGHNIPGDAANETSIAVDPTQPRRMAIGWRQFDSVLSNHREAGWAYTTDGGATWTFPGVIEDGTFRSDPVLLSDAEGNFYYNSLSLPGGNFVCQVFVSNNRGMTWGSSVNAFGGDKSWMAVDRTGGIGHGNLYQSWNVFGSCCGSTTFNRSTDGAASFETPIDVPGMPLFGTLAVGLSGEVFVSGADPNTFTSFLVARSSNARDAMAMPSFDQLTTVDLGGEMVLGAGPNPCGLLGQSDIDVDPLTGDVYLLCSVDPSGADPLDVHFVKSTDGGATWSAPVRVNDDAPGNGAWQWFGTLGVAPNGRIDVVWNDTRATGSSHLSQLFYAFSVDGGANWSPNRVLTPAWDSWVGFPNQDKIGDYYDMVSDDAGAHLAFATTLNGEQDVYYLRIVP